MRRQAVFALAALLATGQPAASELRPSLNFYGLSGLIDMPSADSQPDGQLSTTIASFAGATRGTLTFQITPRLSGAFRYIGIRDLNFQGFSTYYDRSFDLKYRILDEGRYLPAVSIGLQDFVGTGVLAGEYIVATKGITPRLRATAGLGWGRLGSYGEIGTLFGERPRISVGLGGEPNYDQWFRGPAAPFFGLEWRPTDRLGVKLEYSSDAYTLEAERRDVVDRDSPFNFGLEYEVNRNLRLGAYYLYGNHIGIAAQVSLNPRVPPREGSFEPGGLPVQVRPDRATNAEAWATEWLNQDDASTILKANIQKLLDPEGITLLSLALSADAAEVRIDNRRYDAAAQAIGRTARVLTRTLPASIEHFTIVPVERGLPLSATTLRRSDLERLEQAPNGSEALLAAARIDDIGTRPGPGEPVEGIYPRFSWALGPYSRTEYFDPDNPFRIDVGAQLQAAYEPLPGLVFEGAVRRKIAGYLDASDRFSDSVLPRVRSDYVRYNIAEADRVVLDHLIAAWQTKLGPELYGRVSAGYLERMFGGVSAEALWAPTASRLALGAEVAYVRQREFEQGFGFRDYDVATGHLSAYYDLGKGYQAQVDVGRYLAGDWGATFTLDRSFNSGWKIGAFATFTNVSAEEFGEGSFDKGIRVTIPFSWLAGRPSRARYVAEVRPVTRDGGARLNLRDRLFPSVNDYDQLGIVADWGRVWR